MIGFFLPSFLMRTNMFGSFVLAEALVSLLLCLVKKCPTVCNDNHFVVLLGAYGVTLSSTGKCCMCVFIGIYLFIFPLLKSLFVCSRSETSHAAQGIREKQHQPPQVSVSFLPRFPSSLFPSTNAPLMVFVVWPQGFLLGSRCCGAPQSQKKFGSVPVEAGELGRPAGSAQQRQDAADHHKLSPAAPHDP